MNNKYWVWFRVNGNEYCREAGTSLKEAKKLAVALKRETTEIDWQVNWPISEFNKEHAWYGEGGYVTLYESESLDDFITIVDEEPTLSSAARGGWHRTLQRKLQSATTPKEIEALYRYDNWKLDYDKLPTLEQFIKYIEMGSPRFEWPEDGLGYALEDRFDSIRFVEVTVHDVIVSYDIHFMKQDAKVAWARVSNSGKWTLNFCRKSHVIWLTRIGAGFRQLGL